MRLPGRYATVRWQIWQRVTGSWVTVTGKRREGDLFICLYDARLAGVILHGTHATFYRREERVARKAHLPIRRSADLAVGASDHAAGGRTAVLAPGRTAAMVRCCRWGGHLRIKQMGAGRAR